MSRFSETDTAYSRGKEIKKLLAIFLFVFFGWATSSNAMVTLLHEFAGGKGDGAEPHGSLILSGCTLYGMTEYGGDDNKGVVFSVLTDDRPIPTISEWGLFALFILIIASAFWFMKRRKTAF